MVMLKQELDETKSERDAALENAIRMKSDAEVLDTDFNIPKFDLLELRALTWDDYDEKMALLKFGIN